MSTPVNPLLVVLTLSAANRMVWPPALACQNSLALRRVVDRNVQYPLSAILTRPASVTSAWILVLVLAAAPPIARW